MKILILIDTLWLGGAQRVVKGIMENALPGTRFYLYSLRIRNFNIEIDSNNVIENTLRSRWSMKPMKKIREIVEENDIDVLHCTLPRSMLYGWRIKKRFFPDIKLVFHEQGDVFDPFPVSFLLKRVLRRASSYVDLWLGCSTAVCDKIMQYAADDKIETKVLYNFVDTEYFRPYDKKDNDKFIIGFAGRLIPRKGWRDFIHAVNLLKNYENFEFIIAGDDRDRNKMLRLIKKLGLGERIKYLNYVDDMQSFYNALHAFVIPSHWEPMGMAAIEAQACAVPLVASDIPGLNEIIDDGENAVLSEAKNPKNIADKLLYLYRNKELREKLASKGLQNASKYSLPTYLEKLSSLYKSLNED